MNDNEMEFSILVKWIIETIKQPIIKAKFNKRYILIQ